MCILAFAWKTGSEKLILAANRDEFFSRPTKAASFWDDGNTLGGIDLKHGGSWLAVNRRGRLAAITNYRDPANIKAEAPSRGSIVKEFVTGTLSPKEFVNRRLTDAFTFNGFNLLMMDRDNFVYFSNVDRSLKPLDPGVYALSNRLLDTRWPKTLKVKKGLQTLIHRNSVNHESLLQLLIDRNTAPDDELPDTGVPIELERSLSPVFISMDGYGTRCSTIITVSNNEKMRFTEVSYDTKGEPAQRKEFAFSIQ